MQQTPNDSTTAVPTDMPLWHVSFHYLNKQANRLFNSLVVAAPTAEAARERVQHSVWHRDITQYLQVQAATPGTLTDYLAPATADFTWTRYHDQRRANAEEETEAAEAAQQVTNLDPTDEEDDGIDPSAFDVWDED